MDLTHRSTRVAAFVECGQDCHLVPRLAIEVVPLVEALEGRWHPLHRRMRWLHDIDRCPLRLGVVGEVGPDQTAIPGPVVFGIGGGVNPDESISGLDEALHRPLLLGIEDVFGSAEKHDHLVFDKGALGEDRCVLRCSDGEAVFLSE